MLTPKEILTYRRNFWSAWRDSIIEGTKDTDSDEHHEMFLESLECYIADFQSKIDESPATLEYLASVKVGLRKAIEVLEFVHEQFSERLAAFTPPSKAPIIEALDQIISDLSLTVWQIELQYPELQQHFNDERESHHQLRLQWAAFEKSNPID